MNDIETLVGHWLSVPEVADALGIPHRQARKMIADGDILSQRVGANQAVGVPAVFIKDGALLPALAGTVTVLLDAHLSRDEALQWLFTPDDTLPLDGAPIDMLVAGRKAEVRKRAQEMAF
ncbi:Rv2175c family DNA-binding protein [Leekyejoonella antrihumi]|uniref:Helix-turn-helix domain-containing protein n=1 Tax=Leekyejoonella antrihumi TaxID=1660198 RepID=A0A563E515_9MICO|nr:Rv2175c family DNA-binding protein [Leekyejoonella antrihumi]TWP36964.1 helix-turn-helix domain-containing protein [Leekyejoonella antrihumi]